MDYQPNQMLDIIRAFVLAPDPDGYATVQSLGRAHGSANLQFLGLLWSLVVGEEDAEAHMRYWLQRQIDSGLMLDELGSGYAGTHLRIAMVLWRWCTDQRLDSTRRVVEEWLSLVLLFYQLHTVEHRDSVIAATPGPRRRTPVSNFPSACVQILGGRPVRKYGLSDDDPPDRAGYYWRADAEPAAWILETAGIEGVSAQQILRSFIVHPNRSGIRTHFRTIVGRYPDGSLVSYIPDLQSGDAPMPGVVARSGSSLPQVLQFLPQGPRAWKDHQWKCNPDAIQRCWVEDGRLHADLRGAPEAPDGSRGPVERQNPSVALPPGRPLYILEFDPHHEPRELEDFPGAVASAPAPTPPTPQPEPPTGGTVPNQPSDAVEKMLRLLEDSIPRIVKRPDARAVVRQHFWLGGDAPVNASPEQVIARRAMGRGVLAALEGLR